MNPLNKIRKLLCARKARLRGSMKITINMKTLKLRELPTIEMQIRSVTGKRTWMPIMFPDGRWYFRSAKQRNEALKFLTA